MQSTKSELSLNWFLRHEILFILDCLESSVAQQTLDKSIQLRLAYKVIVCLTEAQINDILRIFSQFIFNIEMYTQQMNLTSDKMNQLKSTYGKICAESYFNNTDTQAPVRFLVNKSGIRPMLFDYFGELSLLTIIAILF